MPASTHGRVPFRAGASQVGWVLPDFAERLRPLGCSISAGSVCLDEPLALQALAARAAATGEFSLRHELFDVREAPGSPVVGQIDRAALPVFGIAAEGVHLNGLVAREDGLHVWVARRASTKALDPGKLDHLVAGGIAAGMTPWQTLVKEAAEEAGMPEALVRQAASRGTISYSVVRPEGLRRDRLHCFDLMLPAWFRPEPRDGEVESFSLLPIGTVREAIRATDDFKFNVKLVLADLFRRLDQASAGASRLG